MELVARGDGILRKRLINEGDTAPVGTLAGVIATADENIDALVAGAGSAPAAGAAAPAQVVAKTEESAGASSVPRRPEESQGEASTPPQQKVADVPPAPPSRAAAPAAPAAGAPAAQGDVRSSPLARRLASERGLDLTSVQGSGPNGRIIKRDIEAAAAAGVAPRAAASAAPSGPVIPREGDFHDEPLSQIRKTIAKRLGESIGPIPTFYLTAEYDLTRVMEMRKAMAELGDQFKVSVNDVLLKATAIALSQHPEVNAHWLGDKIRYHNRVHLGMAVATDVGLIVPVIWDADRKRMSDISREAKELAKRARERTLRPEEFTGSTFSVSNLGMFGIDQFTAIINPPEAGILAIGTSEEKLVVVDGEPVVRNRVRVTMSCDHRIIDGAVGAKFLQTLRRLIENPLMLVY
jgi:pyruvate dehydrogenase E2 component (dihydrolipoamide acetyltransferase)